MGLQRGFTLVEVLVALSIMALMGSMSWVGMDALLKSKERTESKSIENAQLQIALGQWASDLCDYGGRLANCMGGGRELGARKYQHTGS